MSHFYGRVRGAGKTEATRRGHKSTGLTVEAATWKYKVVVELEHDPETGEDRFAVYHVDLKGGNRVRLAKGTC